MTLAAIGNGRPKVAFLDSNALIQLFQFWDVCRTAGVGLEDVSDWESLKEKIERSGNFAGYLGGDDARDVKVGMRCFQHLSARREAYIYYTSIVCRSEMHHTVLESIGLERLTARRVPHSLRVRRPQLLFRRALGISDYQRIKADLCDFQSALWLDYSLDIVNVEDGSSGAIVVRHEVWDTAAEIWSRVLIEVMDSYIYAASIESGADVFVTSDGNLRGALLSLHEQQDEWAAVAKSLNVAIGRDWDSSFPRPVKPGDSLPP